MSLALVAVLVALADVGALGPAGRVLSAGAGLALGVGRFVVPLALAGIVVASVMPSREVDAVRVGWGIVIGLVAVSGIGDLAGGRPGWLAGRAALARAGGWLGVGVGGGLDRVVGWIGALVILIAIAVVAVVLVTGVSLATLGRGLARGFRATRAAGRRWGARRAPRAGSAARGGPASRHSGGPEVREMAADDAEHWEPVAVESGEPAALAPVVEAPRDEPVDVPSPPEIDEPPTRPASESWGPPPQRPAGPPWQLPPLGLLGRTREQRADRGAVERAGAELVEALAAHGVETMLVGFTVGPTVTRFELELGPGVKVSRVTSLNRDIAYAMATPDVRILAPIPGRSAIGVEVPNRTRALVALGDLVATEEARQARHPLDVPIGRDIAGRTVIINLAAMPHVLISGATGAGKSSCINALVTALVMRSSPEQVRLVLIDPKRVEMSHYQDLPHLIAPVVVDPKKAAGALTWAVREMERRYDVLAAAGVRDIAGYHDAIERGELVVEPTSAEMVATAIGDPSRAAASPRAAEALPFIVVVVDELNDLMMVAARDVEESVVRIAQMARAVGIHLVLATQRPSVDVITGVIKANIPSRMAFAVSSLADSRVILDQAGAERLIGKGDMLLVTASSSVARRIQSPWVSEAEVQRVVAFWRAQGGRRESVVAFDGDTDRGPSASGDDDDELVRQARDLVLRTQSGSTSMLQRKLRVGFARAGRLMDQLEIEGVVAAGDGSKARRVLQTFEEYYGTSER
ncbi:MAG: DNA translocase FtsK [Acidimicrobiales bacterium]